jgi:hypothetical protein
MRPVWAGSPAPVHAFSLSCVASYDAAVWQGAPRDQTGRPHHPLRGRVARFPAGDRVLSRNGLATQSMYSARGDALRLAAGDPSRSESSLTAAPRSDCAIPYTRW